MDELYESLKDKPIGTTKRGIGPCYADKANRVGLRVYDMLLPAAEVADKIDAATRIHNMLFEHYDMGICYVNPRKLAEEYCQYGKQLSQMIVNADHLVSEYCERGDKIVVEGAQAFRLDLDNGDYPNVTSSNCATNGTLNGAHLNHKCVEKVIVCVKAHDSRVGNGPFPTEQPAHIEDDKVIPYVNPYVGDIIREEAKEYGADCLCVNHLDTMGKIGDIIGEVRVCTSYVYQGKQINYYPDDMEITGSIPKPQYETIKGGWEISPDVRNYDELPDKAKKFIELIEKATTIPVRYIGIGPGNDDLIVRDK